MIMVHILNKTISDSKSILYALFISLQTQDLDVMMVEIHVTFGHTMSLDDLGGGDVTPPPCATSVAISTELAKAIEEEIYLSSDILGSLDSCTRSPGSISPELDDAPLANVPVLLLM